MTRSLPALVTASLFATAILPARAATTLAQLAGTWRVAHVRIDEASSRRASVAPDDPRFVGRTVTISDGAITLDAVSGPQSCQAPTLEQASMGLSRLLAGGPMAGQGAGPGPSPAAYHLPVPSRADVAVLWVSCKQGGIGPGFGTRGDTWMVPLPDHTLAMAYQDGSILVLARDETASPSATGPAQASFPCAKASSASERAICNSPDLASLDRSVAEAYDADTKQFAGIGDPAATAKLKSSQKAWLRERNACGGDAQCLQKAMGARVQALGNTQTFTGE